MLLAEKGLPQSGKAGYELFNDLGSLGLTSFMQEVTRVRALEGELARTIQTLKGVKAARVHIVMPDPGSFHHYHGGKFGSVEAMIEPRANVEYATQFLKELKQREGSWTMAVARYHAGTHNNAAQKVYICRVMANMVATGFGQWTTGAKQFCR